MDMLRSMTKPMLAVLSLAAFSGCGDPPVEDPCTASYQEVARTDLPSGVRAIASEGDTIAVASASGVHVLRGSDLDRWGFSEVAALDVAIEASTIVVHDGVDAHVFDVSATTLSPRGVVDVSGQARIAVRDSRLVALRHAEGARIAAFEITDLEEVSSLERLGETSVSAQAPLDMVLDGAFAFALDESANLNVLDYSDPTAPVARASLPITGSSPSSQLALVHGFLFVGTPAGVQAFDVRDPSSPSALDTLPGGELLASHEDRLATVEGAELVVYQVDEMGVAVEVVREPIPATTALAWGEDTLLRGDDTGISRLARCPDPLP